MSLPPPRKLVNPFTARQRQADKEAPAASHNPNSTKDLPWSKRQALASTQGAGNDPRTGDISPEEDVSLPPEPRAVIAAGAARSSPPLLLARLALPEPAPVAREEAGFPVLRPRGYTQDSSNAHVEDLVKDVRSTFLAIG